MFLDPFSESRVEKPHPVYVPRDEDFEEIKQNTFATGRLKAALHNLVPSIAVALSRSDIPFTCFSDIDKLYSDGIILNNDEDRRLWKPFNSAVEKVLTVSQRLLRYEVPAIIKSEYSLCTISRLKVAI